MPETNEESISNIRGLWLGCKGITKALSVLGGFLAAGQGVTEFTSTYILNGVDPINNRLGSAAIATVATIALFCATQRSLCRAFGWDFDPEPMPPAPWTRAYREELRAYRDCQKRISEMHCEK